MCGDRSHTQWSRLYNYALSRVIGSDRLVNRNSALSACFMTLHLSQKMRYATYMTSSDSPITAERRLVLELQRKRREIAQLEREIDKLNLQIRRLRRNGIASAVPQRLSSIQRMTVEAVILDRLRQSVPPETEASQLWPLVQAVGVTSHSTFRSYLRRMHEGGVIIPVSRGRWRLAPGVSRERRVAPEVSQIADQIGRRAERHDGD